MRLSESIQGQVFNQSTSNKATGVKGQLPLSELKLLQVNVY